MLARERINQEEKAKEMQQDQVRKLLESLPWRLARISIYLNIGNASDENAHVCFI